MLKEKFTNRKGRRQPTRKRAAWGNEWSYSSWKCGSLKQGGDCRKRGELGEEEEKKTSTEVLFHNCLSTS